MMREIVLDTETTGMNPDTGDRIVEIGCLELDNHLPTGRTLQLYLNPEREIPADAIAIHGITNEFVKDKPIFAQVYMEFIEFIKGAKLVIHNAEFDMKFINWELKNVGHAPIGWNMVLDTLGMARRKFPGSPANLDALCRRFGIDNSERNYHGALLDSQLLAEVYLELLGGRQHGLSLLSGAAQSDAEKSANTAISLSAKNRPVRAARAHCAAEDELAAHENLLQKLKDPLWKKNG